MGIEMAEGGNSRRLDHSALRILSQIGSTASLWTPGVCQIGCVSVHVTRRFLCWKTCFFRAGCHYEQPCSRVLSRHHHSTPTDLTQLHDAFIGQRHDSIGCRETRSVGAQLFRAL